MKQKHIIITVILATITLVIVGLLWQQKQPSEVSPSISPSDTSAQIIPPDEPSAQAEEPLSPPSPESTFSQETDGVPEVDAQENEALTDGEGDVEVEAPSLPTEEELAQQSVDDALEQLYQAQDDYIATLDQIMAEIMAEFEALPTEEQTTTNKLSLANAKGDEVTILEKVCDAQVEEQLTIIARAQMVLGDHEMVTEIRSHYAQTKSIYQSQYLDLLTSS